MSKLPRAKGFKFGLWVKILSTVVIDIMEQLFEDSEMVQCAIKK